LSRFSIRLGRRLLFAQRGQVLIELFGRRDFVRDDFVISGVTIRELDTRELVASRR